MTTREIDLQREIDLDRIDALIERAQTFCDLVRLATQQDGEEIERTVLYDAMHGAYECLSEIADGLAPLRTRRRQQLDAEVTRMLKGGPEPGTDAGDAKGGAR